MNRVILMGRLTRDPEVRYTQGDQPMAIANYTLAVDRRVARKDDNNQQQADFISCVAFGKQGEFAEKYLHKGMKIAVEGRIQTGDYTNKEGQKVYTTQVVIDSHEFCESKAANGNGAPVLAQNTQQPVPQASDDEFLHIPDDVEDLPFST